MAPLELPPGENGVQYELQLWASRLRTRSSRRPLNPFDLARFANLLVVDFDKLRDLTQQTRDHLLGAAAEEWSGGATSRALPDGRKVVILNPTHGRARTNATLMEEICHVFLGHQANRLAIIANDEHGKTLARDYRKADEEEAYATGAAALVPYGALRRLILKGQEATEIARHFRVSKDLIEYRLKVTRLWKTYKSARSNPSAGKEFQG